MQILPRSILRLLQRPNVATAPGPMRRLSSPSQSHLSFMASAPPRWFPPALPRRVFQSTAAPNPPVRRVPRFPHGSRNMASSSGVKGEELGEPDRRIVIPPAKDIMITLGEHSTKELIACYMDGRNAHGSGDERRGSLNVISGDGEGRTTMEVIDSKRDTKGEIVDVIDFELSSDDKERWAAEIPSYPDGVGPMDILPNSSHCDGSIYRGMESWKRKFRIADRNETLLEAKMLSDPIDCYVHNGTCISHATHPMLQVFSLKVAKIPVEGGTVELYGYIAARDNLNPLLNYIVNFSRDDPIIVEQGSLINMAGPKRGIELIDTILIEYDMRIKTGEQEKDDLQLIDGVSIIDDIDTWNCSAFTGRIHGDCGAIDITAARLDSGVEATVEIVISEVQSIFNLCLNCFSSGLHEEIQLFDGAIADSLDLKRSVVAVVKGAQMHLKFKIGADSSIPTEHCCSFEANRHGHATQEIRTDFSLIYVKVTWSTLPERFKVYNHSA